MNDLFNTKKLYVILDDLDIMKQESVWNEINPNENIIIFKYNNLDKRNKFYKYFEEQVVEFNILSEDVLVKYIQKELNVGTNLTDINCKKLIDICGGSYNQILLELDKLKHYYDYWLQGEASPDNNIVFNVLDEQGAFHKEISDITFTFIEKVITRDIKQVYELQKQLKQIRRKQYKIIKFII